VSSFPLSAIPPGLAINITFFSYDGRMDIGLIAGYDAVPDVAVIPGYLSDAFSALQAAVKRKATRIRKRKSAVRAVVSDTDGKQRPARPATARSRSTGRRSSGTGKKASVQQTSKKKDAMSGQGNGARHSTGHVRKKTIAPSSKKIRRKSTARITVN
jgi:hypothetical protein